MTGTQLESVISNLFTALRKKVYEEIGYPIVQMEPKSVCFEKVCVSKETEKFLFFFMPREKLTLAVTARIVVHIKYLNISKEDL